MKNRKPPEYYASRLPALGKTFYLSPQNKTVYEHFSIGDYEHCTIEMGNWYAVEFDLKKNISGDM